MYGCTKDNNTCDKKDTCRRYMSDEFTDDIRATLWKNACTENNNKTLYIKFETKDQETN